jgi:hypothetical protein
MEGLLGLILRTAIFAVLMVALIYGRNISPDFKPVLKNLLLKITPKSRR